MDKDTKLYAKLDEAIAATDRVAKRAAKESYQLARYRDRLVETAPSGKELRDSGLTSYEDRLIRAHDVAVEVFGGLKHTPGPIVAALVAEFELVNYDWMSDFRNRANLLRAKMINADAEALVAHQLTEAEKDAIQKAANRLLALLKED